MKIDKISEAGKDRKDLPCKLKVYGYGDGRNRLIVAAASKKEAAAALGISVGQLSKYGCVTGNSEEISTAMAMPKTVFIRPSNGLTPFKQKAVK